MVFKFGDGDATTLFYTSIISILKIIIGFCSGGGGESGGGGVRCRGGGSEFFGRQHGRLVGQE